MNKEQDNQKDILEKLQEFCKQNNFELLVREDGGCQSIEKAT